MLLCTSNWFQSLDRTAYFDAPGDHADELETSVMLHLRPDLVLPREHWGAGREKRHKIRAFSEGWLWTERKWSQVSEDTGIGDPKSASVDKGERFFSGCDA